MNWNCYRTTVSVCAERMWNVGNAVNRCPADLDNSKGRVKLI